MPWPLLHQRHHSTGFPRAGDTISTVEAALAVGDIRTPITRSIATSPVIMGTVFIRDWLLVFIHYSFAITLT